MSDVFDRLDRLTGVRPEFTIGDEFQAHYPSVADAVGASLQLHLHSTPIIRLRIGIGWGELLAEDEQRTPFGQDGPCWWRARTAIDTLHGGSHGRPAGRRTMALTDTELDPLLNGYLLLRDTVMGGFDEVDVRLAVGLLDGRLQNDLADELGINKSSVSRRVNNHGVLALIDAAAIGSPTLSSAP